MEICINRYFPVKMNRSPACRPASCAGYPSITSVSTGRSKPTLATRISENAMAIIKLKTGPAATMETRCSTVLLLKLRESSLASSSPSIMHAPPNGSSFKEYFVSPLVNPTNVGPSPRQNSLTRTSLCFASRKCPSSWNKIIILKIINASKMFNLPPAFYPFINGMFCFQYLLQCRLPDIWTV